MGQTAGFVAGSWIVRQSPSLYHVGFHLSVHTVFYRYFRLDPIAHVIVGSGTVAFIRPSIFSYQTVLEASNLYFVKLFRALTFNYFFCRLPRKIT